MVEKLNIIIAEDNIEWTQMLVKYISKQMMFNVVATTNDGIKEIELIKSKKPDIVITDLKRKDGISGIEAIKEIYSTNDNKPIFIIETGSYYYNEFRELMMLGINHFLVKPFGFDKILEELYLVAEEINDNYK